MPNAFGFMEPEAIVENDGEQEVGSRKREGQVYHAPVARPHSKGHEAWKGQTIPADTDPAALCSGPSPVRSPDRPVRDLARPR